MSGSTRTSNLKPQILQQMPSSASLSTTTAASTLSPALSSAPSTLLEFVNTVPPALTSELVALAPYIRLTRRCAEILSWKSHWEEHWLALAAWWAFCLLSEPTLRLFLPIAFLFVFGIRRWTSNRTSSSTAPVVVTEATLQATLSDIATIRSLLPVPSLSLARFPSPSTLLRLTTILYPPYLLFTYFVPLRVSIALCGTFIFTYRAQWAVNSRASIYRSAHIRWGFYRIYALLSGVHLPPPLTSSPPLAQSSLTSKSLIGEVDGTVLPSPNLRFLFTVYENQRWWMGLDWTAALLPGERPSWCGASQAPLPPPSSFNLPAPAVSYIAVGSGGRAKRTAHWEWEEPEWRVMVKKEGHEGVWRVEKTPPKDKDEESAGTALRMLRAARGRDSASASPNLNAESPERDKGKSSEQHTEDPFAPPIQEEEFLTDLDGWIYGDNKWESGSNKGGMGKYTRYRRWTRIAILVETIELVGPGDVGIVRGSSTFGDETVSSMASSTGPSLASPTLSAFSEGESTASTISDTGKDGGKGGEGRRRSILRQRLKAVVDGSGH
ncbi:integral peroxisomal membrane peroxin-domain-containing protein [Hygrophoropsis aurantiaca]|uniref:Integral peroxisomal membrane peroxin-domain-containing protein n=1 Tax=Hygrophoropsis aurantiaca TaxID=72124 RepID=A0ACB8AJ03_9AGAM|nr:integral peroxisomal membrane peroxin-domain-containing protein [Hygrophoropsis aurantiaca]